MLALIPQSGDFSGAVLGGRSVALLQVPKLAALLFYDAAAQLLDLLG
jgi:hypothetical protein